MLDQAQPPALDFPSVAYGMGQIPLDLRVFLYHGGAAIHRASVLDAISEGRLGPRLPERAPLVESIYRELAAKVAAGASKATLFGSYRAVASFFKWGEQSARKLTLDSVVDDFKAWTEALIHRARVKKDLSSDSAYKIARVFASVIAPFLGSVRVKQNPSARMGSPGRALVRLTRMRRLASRKQVLGTEADKQNLQETFAFGHLLVDICQGLDASAVRGPIPLSIGLRDGRSIFFKCRLMHAGKSAKEMSNSLEVTKAAQRRSALSAGECVRDRRPSLLNQRIEAELLIFIAQTGMNLAQASKLRREHYRWRSESEEVTTIRVFKGRRGGEVVFRAFTEYRAHLKRYLRWLEDMELANSDDRLFPFVENSMIKAAGTSPYLCATKLVCKNLGVRYISPGALRKARVNWLLRRSRDSNLTAELSAHARETLLRIYEQPHHQAAVSEITQFHVNTDPVFQPPGPGSCVDGSGKPEPFTGCSAHAPKPDCISAEGCLFCRYHRDVASSDYCWRLASQRHLKALEMTLWRSPKSEPIHPSNLVIDRINAKLKAIASSGAKEARWVEDAEDSVRSGTFHPIWSAHIELVETFA